MRVKSRAIVLLGAGCLLCSCASHHKGILQSEESQVKLRSIQSRTFDLADRNHMLRAVIATLQDLGFVVDGADEVLGTVSGTKRSGYALRMTVSVRPKGAGQLIVRANAQYNLHTVEDPEPYQQFFTSLHKGLFLDGYAAGSGSGSGVVSDRGGANRPHGGF